MINRSRNHLSSILGDAAVIKGMLDAEVTVPAELEARLAEVARLMRVVAEQIHNSSKPKETLTAV